MEMRVRFLENDLIDFGLHLPRRAKLHRNTGKWLVKQAATEVLPPDVVFARKKGFRSRWHTRWGQSGYSPAACSPNSCDGRP